MVLGAGDAPLPTTPFPGPVGGRLIYFAKTWALLCNDGWVQKTVASGYKIEFTSTPPSAYLPRTTPIPTDRTKRHALESEISALLQKQAIRRVQTEDANRGFFSTFFLAPKKNTGEWRPILNLRPLNKYVRPKRFRMESLRTVLDALPIPTWAVLIDLKDAYLHVPMWAEHRAFLRFRYDQRTYEFLTLPFGLSTAPRVFTRLVKVVAGILRRRQVQIFVYLDDWLIVGETKEETSWALKLTANIISELGFLINIEKSQPNPTRHPVFLGAKLDLQRGLAFPTEDRVHNLLDCITLFRTASVAPAVAWLRLLGLMASMVDVLPWCRLRMRPIQLHLLAYYRPCIHHIQRPVPIPNMICPHLDWWSRRTNIMVGLIFPRPRPTLTLVTDASNTGWGAHIGMESVAGSWSQADSQYHINVLELLAVFRALKHFVRIVTGEVVLIKSDNSTVVSYINRQGGTHSRSCACTHGSFCFGARRDRSILRRST